LSLSVEILTPEKRVMHVDADSVVIPSVQGEVGILRNHAPLLAMLQAGAIRLRRGADMQYFAVSGGFVEVQNNQVKIFAETAELAAEIDVERARQAAEKARAALRAPAPDVDLSHAEAQLRRALVRLRVAEQIRGMRSGLKAG
jgi:F-type H+-transporting ATPase subunit epsilon